MRTSPYKEINLLKQTPYDGDIVSVIENVYNETSPLKRWDARFVKKKSFYRAENVRNNGSVWACGIDGRHKWLHVKDVVACYRKEAV